VNALIGDLVQPTNEVARVLTSVARGDLSQKMSLEIQGRSVKGEFYRIGTTVNAMVDQLSSFAAEVTRVAKEVGTEGKLGGQAKVKGVSGVWKDLTDNVNQLGYLPTVVASGEAALCSIEAAPPDLVLMDIILQGPMDGVQVAERIRARFEIPIIYVTAHADRATLERAKRTRPSGYLIKPYEDDELRQAIGHALGDPRADG